MQVNLIKNDTNVYNDAPRCLSSPWPKGIWHCDWVWYRAVVGRDNVYWERPVRAHPSLAHSKFKINAHRHVISLSCPQQLWPGRDLDNHCDLQPVPIPMEMPDSQSWGCPCCLLACPVSEASQEWWRQVSGGGSGVVGQAWLPSLALLPHGKPLCPPDPGDTIGPCCALLHCIRYEVLMVKKMASCTRIILEIIIYISN